MLHLRPASSVLICRFITLIIAFTIHEFSHALIAVQLGDSSPRREGRLSLNPLRHLDLWGMILVLTMGYGWARPVRVNQAALERNHKAGMMWVALAGPLSNFLLAALAAFLLKNRLIPPGPPTVPAWLPGPREFFTQFIRINISLMVFNLIPAAPLDGEKVAEYFIPDSMKNGWRQLQNNGYRILFVLFFILPYLGYNFGSNIIYRLTNSLYVFLMGG